MTDTLVSEATCHLYLHDLDAETLRWLGDSLEQYATIMRLQEQAGDQKKMRHAGSGLIRLWAGRFKTDANRLDDEAAAR